MLPEHILLFVDCFPKKNFPYMAIAIFKILVLLLKLIQKHVLFPYMVSQYAKF